MNNLRSYIEQLVEQVRNIDTTDLSDTVDNKSTTKIIEEQKVYFWIRLYMNDENSNVVVGDDISIKYTPSGEKLKTKFVAYGKKGMDKDVDDITSYNPDDDKRVLCLMIDTNMVNNSKEIPFIRTLFKTGYHYEYQLVKRDELTFVVDKNSIVLEYFDVDF